MKLRTLALSGASALLFALGTASVLADPEAGNPYTQNPTPQERAQTNQLNTQSSDEAATPAQPSATDQAQYQDQQSQYQDQMEHYQNSRDRYEAQKDRYLDERAEYNYDRSHPYAWWHERYERATLNHFYDIPRAELIDLRVMRDDGFTLGRIREVDRRPDGRVAAVRIAFRNGDSAWVRARDLRYDVYDRIVFTDLTYPEIRELERNS
jgi:hypothetical protein